MKTKLNERLIISLIKDDLINSCLVNKLNAAGLCAENYYLYLSHTIFSLMGYKEDSKTEEVYQEYMRLAKKVRLLHINDKREILDEVARELYQFLLKQKRTEKK